MADMQLGNLIWKITGDTRDFDKSIAASDSKASGFGKTINKLGGIVKGAIAGITVKAFVDMGKKLVGLASTAEETQSKFDVTFSSIREEADLAAQNLAENFGLSSRAAKQLLSDTGDLLAGFGFTQDSALDLSEQVNTLAVDLASFTNYSGGAEGASAALTKALLGETESLKSLGIAITQADIQRLAEEKGIVGEIDRQTKAMLTLEIATSQSKNAIGDFARSQDSFVNQTRIAGANIENFAVGIGERLLPAATAGVKAVGAIAGELAAFVETLSIASDDRQLEGFRKTAAAADNIIGPLTEKNRQDKISEQQIGALIRLYPALTGAMNSNNTTLEDASRLIDEQNQKLAEGVRQQEIEVQRELAREYADYTRLIRERTGLSAEEAAEVEHVWKAYEKAYKTGQNFTNEQSRLEAVMKRLGLSNQAAAQFVAEYSEVLTKNRKALGESSARVLEASKILFSYTEEGRRQEAERKAAEAAEKARAAAELERQKERLRSEREAAAEIKAILESEMTEREKIGAQIEALEALTYESIETEQERIRAIEILRKRYEEAGQAAEESARKSEEAEEKRKEEIEKTISTIRRLGMTAEEVAAEEQLLYFASIEASELAREEKDKLIEKLEEYYAKLQQRQAFETFRDNAAAIVGAVSDIFSALGDLQDQLSENRIRQIERELNAALEAAELEGLSDEELAERKEGIQEDYRQRIADLEYEQQLTAWNYKVLESLATGAMAVLNAISSGFAFGPAGAAAFGAAAAAAAGIQIAAVAAAKPVKAATGGLVPARPGGTLVQVAENSGNELLLNSAESGRAMIGEFADQIASRIGADGGMIHVQVMLPNGKLLAEETAPYFRNGQVKI